MYYTVTGALAGSAVTAALAFAWAVLGRGLRGLSHLRENPRDVALIPLMALVVAVIALPIKVGAGITMNKQGWLTRTADTVGGEGQTEGTLAAQAEPVLPPQRGARISEGTLA